MKALVLTGGAGRNLVPFSATRPKSMCVFAGGSLLKRTLTQLRQAGVTDAIVVLGQNGAKISQAFGTGEELGMKLTYVNQREPGIANAIGCARERFNPGEYFILAYGDVVTAENPYFQLLQSFNSFKGPIATVCLPGPPTGRYGNVYLSGTRITRIVEKPTSGGNLGNYVLAGMFVLPAEIFALIDRAEGDMVRVFSRLLESGGINASLWEQGWIDIESPWDLLAANRMVMDTWEEAQISSAATIEGNVAIQGAVRIEAGSVIKSGAVLVGPCFIGRDCYVGNNSLLRNYTSLGARSIVGYGVELKNCILFGGSDVGRLSFIGDSVIGESVDIGSSTVTINETLDHSPIAVDIRGEMVETELIKLGAFIGDDVKIGAGHKIEAGTVVAGGTIIPHNISVGGKRS